MLDRMLKPKDIAKHLGCSMTTAYAIVSQKDFPKIMIGKRAYIPEDAYLRWIKNYIGKQYIL